MTDIHPRIFEMAKERFRADYEKSYPQPTRRDLPDKPTMQGFWQNRMVQVCFVILAAALLMSAERTFHVLSTVGRSIEGAAGVIVIEGVAGFITFFLVKEKYEETREVHNTISGWMLALVLVSIALALLTNIYSMMIYQNATFGAIEWLLFILAGSIAVFAITVLSHILGTLYVRNLANYRQDLTDYRNEVEAVDSEYRAEMRQWADEFEQAWKRPTNQNKFIGMVNRLYQESSAVSAVGSANIQAPVSSMVSSTASNPARGMGFAPVSTANRQTVDSRQTDMVSGSKVEVVYQAFQNDPELANKSLREIQEITGIGKDTVNKALKLYRDENS